MHLLVCLLPLQSLRARLASADERGGGGFVGLDALSAEYLWRLNGSDYENDAVHSHFNPSLIHSLTVRDRPALEAVRMIGLNRRLSFNMAAKLCSLEERRFDVHLGGPSSGSVEDGGGDIHMPLRRARLDDVLAVALEAFAEASNDRIDQLRRAFHSHTAAVGGVLADAPLFWQLARSVDNALDDAQISEMYVDALTLSESGSQTGLGGGDKTAVVNPGSLSCDAWVTVALRKGLRVEANTDDGTPGAAASLAETKPLLAPAGRARAGAITEGMGPIIDHVSREGDESLPSERNAAQRGRLLRQLHEQPPHLGDGPP